MHPDAARSEARRRARLRTSILRDFAQEAPGSRPSIALYIDILRYLFEGPFEERVAESVRWLCQSSGVAIPFLYHTIVSVTREAAAPNDPDSMPPRRASKEYPACLYRAFFQGPIDDKHRILASQYLLSNELDRPAVEGVLLSICKDSTRPHNIRADAADTLVKLGRPNVRTEAMRVIAELGKDLTRLPTLATNRENVHAFDASVIQFLLELGVLSRDHIQGRPRACSRL